MVALKLQQFKYGPKKILLQLPLAPSISYAFAGHMTVPQHGGGGGLAQGLGIRLFAFGGAYWPLTTAHSDPLWARTCFGCVNGAPG